MLKRQHCFLRLVQNKVPLVSDHLLNRLLLLPDDNRVAVLKYFCSLEQDTCCILRYFLRKLKKLNLNFNRIGDEGARAIAGSSNFINLESLKLGQNKIGTEGAEALNESKTLQNLVHPVFGFY